MTPLRSKPVAAIRGFAFAVMLACLAVSPGLAADTAENLPSAKGAFRLGFTPSSDPIPLNRMHRWVLHLETAEGSPVTDARITVDGGMPAHEHGLPTAPEVTRNLGNGDYLLEGLRFHMPGAWQLQIRIETEAASDTVMLDLDIR